jgi:hypothetical protein
VWVMLVMTRTVWWGDAILKRMRKTAEVAGVSGDAERGQPSANAPTAGPARTRTNCYLQRQRAHVLVKVCDSDTTTGRPRAAAQLAGGPPAAWSLFSPCSRALLFRAVRIRFVLGNFRRVVIQPWNVRAQSAQRAASASYCSSYAAAGRGPRGGLHGNCAGETWRPGCHRIKVLPCSAAVGLGSATGGRGRVERTRRRRQRTLGQALGPCAPVLQLALRPGRRFAPVAHSIAAFRFADPGQRE